MLDHSVAAFFNILIQASFNKRGSQLMLAEYSYQISNFIPVAEILGFDLLS